MHKNCIAFVGLPSSYTMHILLPSLDQAKPFTVDLFRLFTISSYHMFLYIIQTMMRPFGIGKFCFKFDFY